MWQVVLRAPGGVEVPLRVQDAEITDASVVHLDTRMAISQWHAHRTTADEIRRLFFTHRHQTNGGPRPLFMLEQPHAVSVHCVGPDVMSQDQPRPVADQRIDTVVVSTLTEDSGWTVLTSGTTSPRITVWMYARPTALAGQYAVWRAHATVHTAQLQRGSPLGAMLSAVRMEHVLIGSVRRERTPDLALKPDAPENELLRMWSSDQLPPHSGTDLPRTDSLVESCLSAFVDNQLIRQRLPSDRVFMDALSDGYQIESGHSLLHTAVGSSLMLANTPPRAALNVAPQAWIARSCRHLHTATHTASGHPAEYVADAEALQQQLTEGMIDYLRDLWTGTVDGIKASLAKLLPSPETVATLRAIDVRKAASAAKSAVTSKTAESLIRSLASDPAETVYLQEWGRAVLADMNLDESALGELIIDNAPAVEAAMRKMLGKLRYIKASDLKEYGAAVRRLIGNPDLQDGVLQLAAMAKNAGRWVASHSDTIVSAGKTAVDLASKGASVLVGDSTEKP